MSLFPYSRQRISKALQRLSHLPKALGLVWTAARGWTLSWFVLLVVRGTLPVATVYLTKVLVDRIEAVVGAGFTWEAVQWVLVPGGAMAVLLILEQVLGSIIGWIRTAQAEHVVDHIKALVHEKASAVDLAFYDSPDYFDHLNRANSQASTRTLSVLQSTGTLLQNLITMVGISGLLLMYSVWLPVALLVSTLPALWVVIRHNKRHHDWWEETTDQRRWTEYYDRVLTHRSSAPEIRIFNLNDYFRKAYVELRRHLRTSRLRLMREQTLARTGAGFVGLLATGAALAWMLWRAMLGFATLGDLALFYQAFNRGQGLMRSMLGSLGSLYSNILFLEHLLTFLDLEPQIRSPDQPMPAPNPPRRHLRFRDVTFRYPGSRRAALRNFDLTIPAGTTAAIVGSNGAGKSTLIKLLCRFYDPTEGQIEVDGIDLRELDLTELRRMITVMFQYPIRWQATAEDNISFGDLQTERNRRAVETAAQAGGATHIIEALDHGYDTILSKQFEHGTELSGGQWQRISLARAFFRQAPIVVLDEPTSSMDSWAEAKWLRRFRRLVEDRTALIVTHRFTTAMRADVIHVVEDGQVVESGTHEELLEQGNRYAASWKEQMQAGGSPSVSANGLDDMDGTSASSVHPANL